MEKFEGNSLVSSKNGGRITDYQSGSVFDRMTCEVLPLATRQMQIDEYAASPLYHQGLEAISAGNAEEAMKFLIEASDLGRCQGNLA
jgi:hypothetical protein